MRKITKIIVHCSDSDLKYHDNIDTIKRWHLKRGFIDVGYHFFIRKDGFVEEGRNVQKIGAHCYGENENSIGICVSGKKKFTDEQFDALINLINNILIHYNLDWGDVYPHNHFSKFKTCPNFNLEEVIDERVRPKRD